MNRSPSTNGLVISLAAICLTLAGCASEPRIEYREVKTVVPVPCRVTLPDEPDYATNSLALDAPIFDMVRALLVEREQRKARDVEVTAAAKSCS